MYGTKVLIFYITSDIIFLVWFCPGGEIGRHKGLKIPRRKACGFDSRLGHIKITHISGLFFYVGLLCDIIGV